MSYYQLLPKEQQTIQKPNFKRLSKKQEIFSIKVSQLSLNFIIGTPSTKFLFHLHFLLNQRGKGFLYVCTFVHLAIDIIIQFLMQRLDWFQKHLSLCVMHTLQLSQRELNSPPPLSSPPQKKHPVNIHRCLKHLRGLATLPKFLPLTSRETHCSFISSTVTQRIHSCESCPAV